MKIFVYWNRKDKDCKKIFHFMSKNDENSIVEDLEENNDVIIHPIYEYYEDASAIMKLIENNDLIIFFTHGTDNSILKYLNKPDKDFSDFVLIDETNVSLFKDKIVLAFCCASARNLGRYSISSEVGCKAFLGFENDIVYDDGKSSITRSYIYKSYKLAFMKSLLYAINKRCSIKEYQIKLQQMMRKEAMRVILKVEDHSLNSIYSNSIKGAIALGDVDTVLFE